MPLLATATGNAFAHVAYLAWCADTGEAAAIDPYQVDLVLETARANGLTITRIVNTHEHWDHAGRNAQLREATGAEVLAPRAAAGVIETVDHMLAEGDEIVVGTSCRLRVIEMPGHTMTHVGLLGEGADRGEDEPFLLCGDTLFGAGVGNVGHGGHGPTLFATVDRLRRTLDPRTRLYPGHDYLARNLGFTLRHEPDNRAARALLETIGPAPRFTTMAEEEEINLFFRLDRPAVRAAFGEADREARFLAIRRARDLW
ncbi:hydroxyacylglutathione hydrolase [Rhizorhabdus wittichii DC-6]|nr:hydroxyacylglutathione hydrolase [Rhizorhabdus wittichii DC-6]